MDTSKCQCKYCQKLPQREVTKSHAPGIMQVTHNTPSPSRPRPGRTKTMRETVMKRAHDKVYASVQKAPIPAISKSPNVHKTTMLVERNSDLRAVSASTTMKLRRWFRTGELLWCALNHPVEGPGDTAIRFWPGLVDEVKLKTKPVPRDPTENGDAGGVVPIGIDDSTSWGISQSTEYRMHLLAVNHTYLVSDDQVLPYQAHVPPDDLIGALKAFPTRLLNFDRAVMSNFNPCPKEGSARFDEAVAPYAMAVQIGSTLSGYWSLTDEWAFEYHLSPDVLPPSISIPPRPKSTPSYAASLSAAIEAAGQHNEQANLTISPGPSSSLGFIPQQPYASVSGPTFGTSNFDPQRFSERIIGKMASPSMPKTSPYTQMRFQGMWWGAERIWTDEFVRLKVPRKCVAPLGAENILPPAGPGKSVRADWTGNFDEIGAGSRGVFMRLDGLFVVDAAQNDGTTRKEVRASGMLYELVDLDWEEDSAADSMASESSTGGLAPMDFVPGPSPLNPHIPPHPSLEPVVPVTTQPQQVPPNPLASASEQSHPPRPHYIIPEPPTGYKFRPIVTEGHEAVISLSLISGRYYSKILSHPLLESAVNAAFEKPSLVENNNLWALEGLSAGFHNSVDPIQYKATRIKMVEDADEISLEELEAHKQRRINDLDELVVDELAVDELAYPDAMDVDH
ncbi:hypothetical protein H0H87_012589 [Tephrocybe sp. NHM501043]|nr:hypothetical protein H0H87_012589 [Tephrocybe sp. NHM501043]